MPQNVNFKFLASAPHNLHYCMLPHLDPYKNLRFPRSTALKNKSVITVLDLDPSGHLSCAMMGNVGC